MSDETADLRELLRTAARERAQLEAEVEVLKRERDEAREDALQRVKPEHFTPSIAVRDERIDQLQQRVLELEWAVVAFYDQEGMAEPYVDEDDDQPRQHDLDRRRLWGILQPLLERRPPKPPKPLPEPTVSYNPATPDKLNDAFRKVYGDLPPFPFPWGKK
jgi:hypothetical protein